MTATIGEVLSRVIDAPTEEQQIAILNAHLKDYGTDVALMDALRILFDKRYKFQLPEGLPETKLQELPDGCSETNLRTEMRRMYIFIKGTLPKLRCENLFLQIYEGLAVSDRKILVHMKDQSLRSLSSNTVNKVFPNLILEPVDVVAEPEESTKEPPKPVRKPKKPKQEQPKE